VAFADEAQRACVTPDEWERWLAERAEDTSGIWLKIAKQGVGVTTVTYAEALDVALCWGWIDGQKRGLDETYFLQRFSPRRARSAWSRVNVAHVARLTEAKRMQPRGIAEVVAAQADGRWDAAYHPASAGHVPAELAAALAQSPRAQAAWEVLDAANRYALTFRVAQGRHPETRVRNAAKFVAMLERGERIHGGAGSD
jgi:uncharacterized protein YdeI (YjbR/CyaY-like superfamily)